MNFTDEQLKIIEWDEGNAVVVAGAGAGKTRSLVERTKRLKEKGHPVDKILIFTFTKKAAMEIKQRVELAIGESDLYASTIHSLALRIVRDYNDVLGYEKVTIWDPNKRGRVLKQLCKEFLENPTNLEGDALTKYTPIDFTFDGYIPDFDSLEDKKEEIKLANIVKNIANLVKLHPNKISGRLSIEVYKEMVDNGLPESIATILGRYILTKDVCNVIEFDDMIPGAIKILTDAPECSYKTMFEHIMIDEYQDVNQTNVDFVKALSSEGTKSIMAVGDDDQAIYGFRGGNTKHILDFPKVFGGEVLYLTMNFRSEPQIVEFANNIIARNQNRYNKTMVAHKSESHACITSIEPIMRNDYSVWGGCRREIYEEVFEFIKGCKSFIGTKNKDIAILARNNFNLVRAFNTISAMSKSYNVGKTPEDQINFKFGNMSSLFDEKHIRRIIDTMKVVVNPKDFVSFRDVLIDSLKGFGEKSARVLEDVYEKNEGLALHEILMKMTEYPRHKPNSVKGKALIGFSAKIENLSSLIENNATVYEIFRFAYEASGVAVEISTMSEKNQKGMHKKSAFDALMSVVYEHIFMFDEKAKSEKLIGSEKIIKFLDEIATQDMAEGEDEDIISLMTIHASKGKEWDLVILLDVEEGVLPSKRAEDFEEERRLLYVAITRAESMFCRVYSDDDSAKSEYWSEMDQALA